MLRKADFSNFETDINMNLKHNGAAEGVSSTMTKVEIAKDIHLQMWKVFDIWCGKCFAILVGQIQSKQIYRLVTYTLASP